MTGDFNKANCSEFQARLPELISTGEDISEHPHVQSCELCRALLADLETIADAARQLFPSAEPSDQVWEHIESAIKKDEDGGMEPGLAPRSR
jgi:hypothetical protein